MAKMIAFDPPPQVDLGNGWMLYAAEGMRHPRNGLIATVQLYNGKLQDSDLLVLNNRTHRTTLAKTYAKKLGSGVAVVSDALIALSELVDTEMRLREGPGLHLDADQRYVVDDEGTWLMHTDSQRTYRERLANFSATIVTDITYDDGTPETRRSFAIEAQFQGDVTSCVLTAPDFARMQWPLKVLGAQAIVEVGPLKPDHLRVAIQSRSKAELRTVFVHTGWRQVADDWCYLHAGGAITAQGLREDMLVQLQGSLHAYQLPAPPTDPARLCEVFRASLGLRTLAPGGAMVTILGAAYVAPLRPFLLDHPPDFVSWIAGPSGRFKTEYAVLGMQHFGPEFSSRNVPASFIATGNSLERLSYAAKDALLLVDDYYPATDRRTRAALDLTAGRLLRSIGNQTGRPRMNPDTTLRPDLPPRCVALATGEHQPEGHSSNARLFFQPVDAPADAEAHKACLSRAQADKACYSEAMAFYLQWIAQHWDTLQTTLPSRFRALRLEAATEGAHAREPGHAAHLQLGWRAFTACAVSIGALTSAERDALLQATWQHAHALTATQGAMLQSESTVQRFCGLLLSGFAAKRIYLRALDDHPPRQDTPEAWGWTMQTIEAWQGHTETVYDSGQAKMLGYLDAEHLYLLPEPLQEYLAQASRTAEQTWPVDAKTLYRELDEAHLLTVKPMPTWVERVWGKTIRGRTVRLLHIKRAALLAVGDTETREEHASFQSDKEADQGILL